MRNLSLNEHKGRETGVATLFTAVILMIGATTLAFLAAQVVIDETKVTANDRRTKQAVETALAGIDAGIARFNSNGAKIDSGISLSSAPDLAQIGLSCDVNTITSTSSAATFSLSEMSTFGLYYFGNSLSSGDRCHSADGDDGDILISVGWSDDCSALREISVCMGAVPIFKNGEGPEQPLVASGNISAFGNSTIINRYTNISAWSGGPTGSAGNAFGTYLRPDGIDRADLEPNELKSDDETDSTISQQVSNKFSGFGLDVVTNDATLLNADADFFWNGFFALSRSDLYASISVDRRLPSDLDGIPNSGDEVNFPPNGSSGIYWTDTPTENISTGDTYGSYENPAILIFDGDLTITGGEVTGLIYVTGNLTLVGNPILRGSVITEGNVDSNGGSAKIVYVPFGADDGMGDPNVDESGVIIPGSWKDW